MLMPLISSLYATDLAYRSQMGVQQVNQSRVALANSVDGAESPAQLMALAQTDKALMFKGIQDQTNFLVAQQLQRNAQMQLEKNEKQRRDLMAAGATLV